MNKKARGLIISIIFVLVLALLFIGIVIGVPSTAEEVLESFNFSGMKINSFSVDGISITNLDYQSNDFNLKNEFTEKNNGIKQGIYLKNNLLTSKAFNFSTIIEIDYDEIIWNGTKYQLNETPIEFISWHKINQIGDDEFFVPQIWFDNKYNKRIDYTDIARKGGYALAYKNDEKYYVELRIDNLYVESKENYYIDPVFYNDTDGFFMNIAGSLSGTPRGLGVNETNIFVADGDVKLIKYRQDGTGEWENASGGCLFPAEIGSTTVMPIYDKGDESFWVVNGYNNVHHISNSCVNQTGYFSVGTVTGVGSITGATNNGTGDLWFGGYSTSVNGRLVHTINGVNQSDGFNTDVITGHVGADSGIYALTTNGSDFWIMYYEDTAKGYINHIDENHNNMSDGFNVSAITGGSAWEGGMATNGSDIFLAEYVNQFVFHLNPNLTSPDNIPPNVTINTPANTTYAINSITFNATALDGTRVSSCWASIDSGVTNLTLQNTTADYTGTNSSIPDGSYTAHFYCNDSLNNINNSESVEFTINTPPSIPSLLAPENTTGYPIGSTITFVWANSTDSGGDTINYELEIYNESDMLAVHRVYLNNSIAEKAGNTSINVTLSSYINVDDDYYWRVRANDSISVSNWSTARHFQYANWTIVFNLTDSETGEQIDTYGPQSHFDISCDNGFTTTDIDNPYTATNFGVGVVECTFSDLIDRDNLPYFSTIENLTIDSDKTIKILMSRSGGLTQEEHTWLEWLYNCWNNGNCWDLLNNINTTTTQIWQRLTGTDISVVVQEEVISSTLNSTSNITLNYTIDIPYKSGIVVNELLPIRVYFWFTDINRTTCYNQDKASDTNKAESPYCLPLVAETLGPNNGSKTFTVDLRPDLADGTYNFTRSIEIDPFGIWTQYGREDLGQIEVQESGDASINIGNENNQNQVVDYSTPGSSTSSGSSGGSSKTTIIKEKEIITQNLEDNDKNNEDSKINSNNPSITGAVIGSLLTSQNSIFILIIICITSIIFVVITSRTIIKIKNK